MLSKIFDMDEAKTYDRLSDEDVRRLSNRIQLLSIHERYHVNKELFDPSS